MPTFKYKRLSVIAAPLLLVYLIFILVTTYQSQQALIGEKRTSLKHKLEKHSGALSYYYMERRSDISRLSKERSIALFFSNQALKMSMTYGLKSSLVAMQNTLKEFLEGKQLNHQPIYKNTLVINKNREIVVFENTQSASLHDQVIKSLNLSRSTQIMTIDHDRVLISTPINSRGQHLGWVLAEINQSVVIDHFIKHPNHDGQLSFMFQHHETTADALQPDHPCVHPVSGTPFFLKLSQHTSSSSQFLTSHYYLSAIATLAAISFLLLIFGARANSRRIQQRRRARKEEKHRKALEVEVHKRKEGEAFLQSILKTIPDQLWLKDTHGGYLYANPKFERFIGCSVNQFKGKTDHELVYKELADLLLEQDVKVLKTGKTITNKELVAFSKGGKQTSFEVVKSPIIDEDDNIIGVLGISRDVSKQKQNENRLTLLSKAVEQSPAAVIITNDKLSIEYVNKAYENITGFQSKDLINHDIRRVQLNHIPYHTVRAMKRKLNQGQRWEGEFLITRKNGTQYLAKTSISPAFDQDGKKSHYLGIIEDVTLQKEQEQRILYQAHYDALTALPNRFLVLDRLSQILKDASREQGQVGILFVDLDDFKKINDSLGHDIGDKVLIEAGKRLSNTIREVDTVGRLGGDEFLILLNDINDPVNISPIAENLLTTLQQPFHIDGRDLFLSASIGISVYPHDGDNVVDLMSNADMAMYQSKDSGRNTYHFFTKEMNIAVERRTDIEHKMYEALDKNEFFLQYQPIFDTASNQIVGAEALIRWNSPQLGSLSPEEFIPIAEKSGLIQPIGNYVLSTACQFISEIHAQYDSPFKISVNLSAKQFYDKNLVPFIREQLSKHNLQGHQLQLEITETVLLDKHSKIRYFLDSFQDMGISIAMDDFGTGYSSLSYLREYPFDILKIDRCFVNGLSAESADRAVVKASIAMAKGVGLGVVAEGVESEDQLNFLNSHQCEYVQGYYLSKPLSELDFRRLLEQQ